VKEEVFYRWGTLQSRWSARKCLRSFIPRLVGAATKIKGVTALRPSRHLIIEVLSAVVVVALQV
jgi:hypothetical protein